MQLDDSIEVAVSGIDYDIEDVFRFTPKPGQERFVTQTIRYHFSKMLAVILDHVDKSADDELRMYKFIASTVTKECGSGRDGRILGTHPLVPTRPLLGKSASSHCPMPAPKIRTCPPLRFREPEQPVSPGKSYTEPPNHEHRAVQVQQNTLGRLDEDRVDCFPRRGFFARHQRVMAMDLSDYIAGNRETNCDPAEVELSESSAN
eukprot:TRINITY_DN13884_c0_g2_i2.p1 TRINITY_DN13884_c0_g2~~TRINITY_DN13884_c0_g2_i2.p1  ORF type:complete len:204 (+),score=19.71 TRINITY_DN13884_c0_g2_i2:27-638(+)